MSAMGENIIWILCFGIPFAVGGVAMGLTPPDFTLSRTCFIIAALVALARICWWLSIERQPTNAVILISSIAAAFLLIGLLLGSGLYWVSNRELIVKQSENRNKDATPPPQPAQVAVEPSEISISNNIGGTAIIKNYRTDDVFEVYLKIETIGHRYADLDSLDIKTETGQVPSLTNETIGDASGSVTVDFSHIRIQGFDNQKPFIYLMIYRIKGLQSEVIRIQQRDLAKTRPIELILTIAKFTNSAPRFVSVENGAGLALNPPGMKPIAMVLEQVKK